MGVGFGLRKAPVGITGTKYQSLDNVYQIEEAVNTLSATVNKNGKYFRKIIADNFGHKLHPAV